MDTSPVTMSVVQYPSCLYPREMLNHMENLTFLVACMLSTAQECDKVKETYSAILVTLVNSIMITMSGSTARRLHGHLSERKARANASTA